MSEWDKMIAGERYQAKDKALLDKLMAAKESIYDYNSSRPGDVKGREEIIRKLLGKTGKSFLIMQPFYCDYGCNISVGENFFANFHLTVLDEAPVTIGNNCFIGPNVGIYTACHPLEAGERDKWIEWAEPVTIGDSVWIGGGVTICPGVTIGDNCVIGAGSVVVKDIPANSVAVGNPAHVVKKVG